MAALLTCASCGIHPFSGSAAPSTTSASTRLIHLPGCRPGGPAAPTGAASGSVSSEVTPATSPETYRSSPIPWPAFEAAWIARVHTLAALYHPQYYVVVKEPGWYAPMVTGLSRTDLHTPMDRQVLSQSTWNTLVAKLAATVHASSPATLVGVSVAASTIDKEPDLSRLALTAAARDHGVAFLGFDIYDTTGFNETQQYVASLGSTHKHLWIAEAWSTAQKPPAQFDPARAPLDAQWMQALYRFALYIHATGVSPFDTDVFAAYAPPPRSAALTQYYFQRSSAFTAFARIVAENRRGASG